MYRKNPGLKIFALMIAIALSIYVNSEGNRSVVTLVVPVELTNLPESKMILQPSTAQAEVRVRGPSYLLSRLYSNAPSFSVDLPEDVGNRFSFQLKAETLDLPVAVEVLSIDPGQVEFVLDTRIEKTMPVNVITSGQLPKGIQLDGIQIMPATVDLTGAESELRGVAAIDTMPLDLSGASDNLTRELELKLPGKYTQGSRKRVMVTAQVTMQNSERRFVGLPVEMRSNLETNYTVLPARVEVEVSGPSALVDSLEASTLIPYVRIATPLNDSAGFDVHVDVPDRIAVLKVHPERVTLSRLGAKGRAGQKK